MGNNVFIVLDNNELQECDGGGWFSWAFEQYVQSTYILKTLYDALSK